jgi:hypothetical protein
MRPRTVRRFYAFMAVGAFLTAAILFGAGVSRADVLDDYAVTVSPVICTELDNDPTFHGIEVVAQSVVEAEDFTYQQAGRIIAVAVTTTCVRHVPLLQQFVATYTHRGVMIA